MNVGKLITKALVVYLGFRVLGLRVLTAAFQGAKRVLGSQSVRDPIWNCDKLAAQFVSEVRLPVRSLRLYILKLSSVGAHLPLQKSHTFVL